MTTIAIQGDVASFHDIAAKDFFGESSRAYCDTFADTFAALADGRADNAVVAIENSLFGSINEVYDLLLKHSFSIIGEVYLRIDQCLIGLPGTKLEDVTTVYSHPVALAQCEAFLDENVPQALRSEYHDTAAAVKLVKEQGDAHAVAIAGKEAAELYGMEVLAENIETNKENYTRFVALSRTAPVVSGEESKTSLVLTTSHQPGALYQALGTFAKRSMNLSKLQSRPIIGKAWHYMFYVDVGGAATEPAFQEALVELKEQGCEVTLLGSYKSGLTPN